MLRLFKDKNYLRLCLATFFMSSCLQLVWVVMPFIVKSLNGSDTAVGLCFMGQMGVYVIFCLLVRTFVDRLNPKKVLSISAAVQIVVLCGIYAVVRSETNLIVSPITQLVLLMSMTGIVTAFFWPIMMGWISTGYESEELTRRLGFYNVTWGMANMILPIVGGYLMLINYLSSVAAGVIMIACCFAVVLTVRPSKEKHEKKIAKESDIISEEFVADNRQFVWISRLAMFSTFICIGVCRSQLGILYKFELGFPESAYGWSVSLMCLFNVMTFYMMGRSHRWHYKKGIFAGSQFLTIICMIIIVFSRNLSLQLLASGLIGISYGFIYSSHQYYGVSGGKNRSGRMAIHETVLGAGYGAGSLLGGVISDGLGRTWPYIFGGVVIILAGAVQILLWHIAGRNHISSKENTSVLTSPT